VLQESIQLDSSDIITSIFYADVVWRMAVRRNFPKGGQNQHYPFQVADDATQMDVHKTLYLFIPQTKFPMLRQ